MILEIHDNELGNTLCAVIRNIDYKYQAEQWILDTIREVPTAILWILFTNEGKPLQVWERNGFVPINVEIPQGIIIDPRSLKSSE